MERFFKVCHIRTDGGTGETTFIGYAAETCAIQNYLVLAAAKTTQYVCVIQRNCDQYGSNISWETTRFYQKERPLSVG